MKFNRSEAVLSEALCIRILGKDVGRIEASPSSTLIIHRGGRLHLKTCRDGLTVRCYHELLISYTTSIILP
mgnify:FL=1